MMRTLPLFSLLSLLLISVSASDSVVDFNGTLPPPKHATVTQINWGDKPVNILSSATGNYYCLTSCNKKSNLESCLSPRPKTGIIDDDCKFKFELLKPDYKVAIKALGNGKYLSHNAFNNKVEATKLDATDNSSKFVLSLTVTHSLIGGCEIGIALESDNDLYFREYTRPGGKTIVKFLRAKAEDSLLIIKIISE